jgi:tRNA-dihydrouridine synthase
VEHRGAEQANKIMRKIFSGYFKGFAGAAKLRHQLVNSKEINQTLNILKKFQQEVS